MRISDWSADVCSSDLRPVTAIGAALTDDYRLAIGGGAAVVVVVDIHLMPVAVPVVAVPTAIVVLGTPAVRRCPRRWIGVSGTGRRDGQRQQNNGGDGCGHAGHRRLRRMLRDPECPANRRVPYVIRSEERRIGEECVRTCRARGAPY